MGLPLVEVLQLNDLISEAAVAQSYAEHSDLRFLDLTRRPPTRAWVLTVPENVARRKNCLIFGEVSGELVAVVADPFHPSLRAALQARYERPIQYVVSSRYQILDVINDVYGTARAHGSRLTSTTPLATAV